MFSGPPPFLPAFMALNLASFAEARIALQNGQPVLRAQQADLLVLEGLLSLERGDTAAARLAFAEAQSLCAAGSRPAAPFAGAPIAARYLSKLAVRK
jgi:hypothetical protein